MGRYFLDQDQDSHWFIVPESLREAWDAWRELDPDDEKAWTAPKGCLELGSHPNTITFTDWKAQ
jgi:hypothetical protein